MNGIIFLNADQNILLYKSHEVLVPPRYPGNIGTSIQWTTHAHITKKKILELYTCVIHYA